MQSLDLQQLRTANVIRCGDSYHSLEDRTLVEWLVACVGELGSIAHILKKRRNGEAIPDERLAEEAADVLIYLDLLCAGAGIDLAAATIAKFNKVSEGLGSPVRLPVPEGGAAYEGFTVRLEQLTIGAYGAYNEAGPPGRVWLTWDGKRVPAFENTSEVVRHKWRAATSHAAIHGGAFVIGLVAAGERDPMVLAKAVAARFGCGPWDDFANGTAPNPHAQGSGQAISYTGNTA